MHYMKRKIPTLVVLGFVFIFAAILSFTGCGDNSSVSSEIEEDKVKVVATTTMLADLAKEIGGDTLSVDYLMGPGIDPHLYQASAGDVTRLQEADVVLYNGFYLEGKMGEIFASLESQGKTVISVEDALETSLLLFDEDDDDLYDPHVWFDVSLWKMVAAYVAEQLSLIYPENSDYYQDNLQRYLKELDELELYIMERIQEVPEHQRVLITAHDAFQYFGHRYGFEVIGLQGISTEAEAGTADVMNLAQFIEENQIKAIFIESSVPPKTIEALQAAVAARGFDVVIGGELYSDSLGDAASGADTYILTFKANINTIVEALK